MADRADLKRVYEGCLVSIAAHGRDALTGGPVDRLPPHLWEALRLELQRRYRNATGEEFAVLVADHSPSPQSKTHVNGERKFCDFPNCDCSSGAAERCSHPPVSNLSLPVLRKIAAAKLTSEIGGDLVANDIEGAHDAMILEARAALGSLPASVQHLRVTDAMRQAACRALNERGQGNAVTIADVNAMLLAALATEGSAE